MTPAFIIFICTILGCLSSGISFSYGFGIPVVLTTLSSYFSVGTLSYVLLNTSLSRYMKFVKVRKDMMALKMSRFYLDCFLSDPYRSFLRNAGTGH